MPKSIVLFWQEARFKSILSPRHMVFLLGLATDEKDHIDDELKDWTGLPEDRERLRDLSNVLDGGDHATQHVLRHER